MKKNNIIIDLNEVDFIEIEDLRRDFEYRYMQPEKLLLKLYLPRRKALSVYKKYKEIYGK